MVKVLTILLSTLWVAAEISAPSYVRILNEKVAHPTGGPPDTEDRL